MKRIAVALVVAFIPGPLLAQSHDPSIGSGNIAGTVRPAPVGHRQPRSIDVPQANDARNGNLSVYDRDPRLERALRICRGC